MAFNFSKFKDDKVNTVGTKANLEKLAGEIADMNYTDFTEGEDYASLAKRYSTQGQKAMDDTVGKVAARTGGIASSYATAAGGQAYNEYMGKLEDAARAMYDDQRQEKVDNLGISKTLYDQNYQEKRDEVADSQWRAEFYVSNDQWNKQYENTIKTQKFQDAQVIWSTGRTLSDKQLADLGIDRATEAAYKTYYESQGEKEFEPTMTWDEIQTYLKDGKFVNDLAAKNYYYYTGKYPDNYYGDQYETIYNFVSKNKDNPSVVVSNLMSWWDNGNGGYDINVLDQIAQNFGIDLTASEK